MAGKDEIIPNILTKRLYAYLKSKKKMRVFPEAGHKSRPVRPDENRWFEVMSFVSDPD